MVGKEWGAYRYRSPWQRPQKTGIRVSLATRQRPAPNHSDPEGGQTGGTHAGSSLRVRHIRSRPAPTVKVRGPPWGRRAGVGGGGGGGASSGSGRAGWLARASAGPAGAGSGCRFRAARQVRASGQKGGRKSDFWLRPVSSLACCGGRAPPEKRLAAGRSCSRGDRVA